jgi:hypothetical protein
MSSQADYTPLDSKVETAEEKDSNLPEVEDASEVTKADIICDPGALAAENENTPEVVTKISAVEQNISPASAAIMQSLFYKEMMVKPDEDDNSSNDSYESSISNLDPTCSCQEQETSESEHDVSSLVNNEEGFKSFDLSDFVAEEEADSKDASDMQDQFSDGQEAEDLPKEDVILNILIQLDPEAVKQVCLLNCPEQKGLHLLMLIHFWYQ